MYEIAFAGAIYQGAFDVRLVDYDSESEQATLSEAEANALLAALGSFTIKTEFPQKSQYDEEDIQIVITSQSGAERHRISLYILNDTTLVLRVDDEKRIAYRVTDGQGCLFSEVLAPYRPQ